MSTFETRSFCRSCGRLRRTMSKGFESDFFDRGTCDHCGDYGPGEHVVARRERVGRWPWQRAWRTPEGVDPIAPASDEKQGTSRD